MPQPSSVLEDAKASESLLVLVIENDESRRRACSVALEARGHHVVAVAFGKEGTARALAEPFDAVLLSQHVEDMPVLQVLRELTSRRSDIPVVVLAPVGAEEFEIRALREGAVQTVLMTPRFSEFLPRIVEDEVQAARNRRRLEDSERIMAAEVTQHRQTLGQLRESERRLHMAVSQAPLVMWTTDADLRITWAIGAGLEAIGLDPRALLGRSLADVQTRDTAGVSPVVEHRRAVSGHSVRYEVERSGRWLDVRLEPLRSPTDDIVGVIGLALDITDRRRVEDALRLSEDRFVMLSRATSEMAWDWDLGAHRIWRNENIHSLFGYTPAEAGLTDAWWEDRIHPEDRERVTTGLTNALAKGERFWGSEYRWKRRDGTYAVVLDRGYVLRDPSGNAVRMVGSTVDITTRKRQEQIREAIYRISEAAVTTTSLPVFFEEVHKIIGTLMPAQNFYIALHDLATDMLSFPYFVDENERPPEPYKAGRGLTEYVLRTGKPFYASTEGYERLVESGDVVRIGPMSIDWVGVPLVAQGSTLGAVVVQTYTEGVRYGEEERDILSYVSEQIAMAIERKRAEEALRDSEERYRLLFETNPTPMWVYDVETLRFLAANDTAVEQYGYSRKEFLSMTLKDIRPPKDVPALLESIREARPLIEHSGIWTHRRKDGTLLNVEITSHSLTFGGRPAVLVLASNVTERKRAQDALEAAEAKFRGIVEQSLVGTYIIQNGRFAYVNPKLAEIFGYTPDEVIASKTVMDLTDPEDRPLVAENFRRRMSGETPSLQYAFRGMRKEGSRIYVEVHGSLMKYNGAPAVIGSLIDVTQRQLAEDSLRNSEARFRALFEAAADAILLVNEHGIIQDANPAALALVESSMDRLVGRDLETFFVEEDRGRTRAYLGDCFAGRQTGDLFEVSLLLPSGHRKFLAVRSRLAQAPGRESCVEMLVRDVTEQREMQRRLVASERLASVGQMAAYVAHEINTPLANVSLLAAAAKRRTKDPEVRERLEKIDVQRRHAAAIITDLLSFTRQREIQSVEADLRNVMRDSIDQIEPYRTNEVSLVQELGDRPVSASVDPLQMQEVFTNLLRNAFEATERGSVTVRLESRPGYRIVIISDTGSGIPADIQARLFQPFVTTKRQTGGTGLGLALCRNIVAAHGGEIHCTSAQGTGTTFTIVLPQGEGT